MADQRDGGIAWCDETWNPIRGCSRVSEGCRNCYAEAVAARFSGPGLPYEGLARYATIDRVPLWTGVVKLVEKHLEDPLRWKRPRRIFVNSMSDLFHEGLSDADILRVFEVIAKCQHHGHTFQILTKRAERMADFCSRLRRNDFGIGGAYLQTTKTGFVPLTERMMNVHLGVSVEDQKTADERIPWLLKTPAAVRWVSYEPALGPVLLRHYLGPEYRSCQQQKTPMLAELARAAAESQGESYVDWVIVGGESGPGARAFDLRWARDTISQCKAAGVPCFVKQLGAMPYDSFYQAGATDQRIYLKDRKGGDWNEWDESLRVREFPQ